MTRTAPQSTPARTLLNKVPEVTLFFWIIKVLSTTVGETFADFLSGLGLGLSGTTMVMTVAFIAVLVWQFRTRQYVPGVYWLTVVLISVVGTLITDNLTDALGVPLELSTAVFAVALGATFTVWYAVERTLSIHSIVTFRREAFYWLAILFTFALGTAAGDLVSERFGVGYWATAIIVALLIAAIAVSHKVFGANAVLTFWIAYVLTRPLGASPGDGLSQPRADGGLGLGTTWTSVLFLVPRLSTFALPMQRGRGVGPLSGPHPGTPGPVVQLAVPVSTEAAHLSKRRLTAATASRRSTRVPRPRRH